MIYLLDTDTFIFVLQGTKRIVALPRKKRARQKLNHCRIERSKGNTIAISAITLAELEFGSRNSAQYEEETRFLKRIINPFSVVSFDAADSPIHYGQIKHALKLNGTMIGPMDLLIAAHALALSATLVSNNTAHFNRVPHLKIANWS